jgi:hypothetical protein
MPRITALTNFGLECRRLRTESGYTIADQARVLEIPPWEITAIECGAKEIPDGYVLSVGYWLKLSSGEYRILDEAAKRPRNVNTLPGMNRKQTDIILRQFRDLPKLRPTVIRGLKRTLKAVVHDRQIRT